MTDNDNIIESVGSRPRRQHYVSAMLLKQWGDQVEGRSTVIGHFDMYTRQTSTGTAGAECVFEDVLGAHDGGDVSLAAIKESEDEWWTVEDVAAAKLDQIRTRMDAGGFTPDVKNILKQPQTLDALVELAVLHHARNLRAILECWHQSEVSDASADERAERLRAGIAARAADAEARYRGGVVFRTPARGSEFVLGSIPVSEDEIYGPSDAPAEFMMPLTPLLMMAAARRGLSMAEDAQFMEIDEPLVRSCNQAQSARAFGLPFVYCRPSYLAEAEVLIAEFTCGGFWHWQGLEQRFERHQCRVQHRRRVYVRRVLEEQQQRQAECGRNPGPGSPTFPEEHQRWCRENADAVERILHLAGVPPAEPRRRLTYGFTRAIRELHT